MIEVVTLTQTQTYAILAYYGYGGRRQSLGQRVGTVPRVRNRYKAALR